MNYAVIKDCDIANGPGVRVSLFVSGCTHHCPGCFNQQAWDFDYGQPFTNDTIEKIMELFAHDHITGFTLLGGEPFEISNQAAILPLLQRVSKEYPKKSIWAYSGYLFEDIIAGKLGAGKITEEIMGYLDVLVDGPFVAEKKDLLLRFRGSSNQRIIDVKKSLATGAVVLWQDWQGERNTQ